MCQVATVLANMSAIESCTAHLMENCGVQLLVNFLCESPAVEGSPVEKAACERMQQKAAIALTRLCRDQEIAQLVVELQGTYNALQWSLRFKTLHQ